jgi:hypothetical protein
MIKLEVKVWGRINIVKSIGFLKGTVVSQTEKGMRKSFAGYTNDLQGLLKDTCEQRL